MKKLNVIAALLIITQTSCEVKEIDDCGCKFNLDIFIKNKNIDLEKYSKFYSEKTLEECFEALENGKNTKILDAYKYYNKKCPKYELELNNN